MPKSTAFFVVAAVLASATQLRMSAAPLGPGELLLVTWLAVQFALIAIGRRSFDSAGSAPYLAFWTVSLLALLAGGIVNRVLDLYAYKFTHDLLTFVFVPLVFCVFVTLPQSNAVAWRAAEWFVGFLATAVILLFGVSLISQDVAGLSLWFEGVRFQGWAANPNQLALALATLPFLALYLARRSRGMRAAVIYVLAAGSIVVGIATLSDALFVAWGGALAAAVLLAWLQRIQRPFNGIVSAGFFMVVVPLLGVAAAVATGRVLGSALFEQLRLMYELQGQGSVRITLWENGIKAIGASPVVGLGPGAHSGLLNPFGGAESHNTWIDWAAATGLAGIAAYIALLAAILVSILKRRSAALLGAFVSLIALSMFHYVIRHPIYWLALFIMHRIPEDRVSV
jgi:O-antigen ligase